MIDMLIQPAIEECGSAELFSKMLDISTREIHKFYQRYINWAIYPYIVKYQYLNLGIDLNFESVVRDKKLILIESTFSKIKQDLNNIRRKILIGFLEDVMGNLIRYTLHDFSGIGTYNVNLYTYNSNNMILTRSVEYPLLKESNYHELDLDNFLSIKTVSINKELLEIYHIPLRMIYSYLFPCCNIGYKFDTVGFSLINSLFLIEIKNKKKNIHKIIFSTEFIENAWKKISDSESTDWVTEYLYYAGLDINCNKAYSYIDGESIIY